jgi:hypothetical protein
MPIRRSAKIRDGSVMLLFDLRTHFATVTVLGVHVLKTI